MPPEPSFEIYTAATHEPIVELYSWEHAHHIAHMIIDDCPARSPVVVKDRSGGMSFEIGVDKCGLVMNCGIIEIAEARAGYVRDEFTPEEEIRTHLDNAKLRTRVMQTAKIRKTGNSNAVSLSRDFEELGYIVGAEVAITTMPSGELRIIHQYRLGELIREMNGNPPGFGPPYPANSRVQRQYVRHSHSKVPAHDANERTRRGGAR